MVKSKSSRSRRKEGQGAKQVNKQEVKKEEKKGRGKAKEEKSNDEEYVDLTAFVDGVKILFKEYGVFIFLLIMFLGAFYIRMLPNVGNYLQAIDPFYLSRMTDYVIQHNFHLPVVDHMRYYPDGMSPHKELYFLYYIYAVIYVLIFKHFMSFMHYAQVFPALLGALYVFIFYGIAKQIFKRRDVALLTSFFFAFSPSMLFRSSKGFFEKEPLSGFFILLSLYFFIKTYNERKSKNTKNKIIDALLASTFTFLALTTWGGAVALVYGYAAFTFLLLFTGRVDKEYVYLYGLVTVPVYLFLPPLIATYSYKSSSLLAFVGSFVLSALFEYYSHNKGFNEEDKRKKYPVYAGGIAFLVFIMGFFSSTISRYISSILHILFYKKGVIESTVAENVEATWSYFTRTFGASMKLNIPLLKNLNFLADIWFLAMIGSFVYIWDLFKRDKNKNFLYVSLFSNFVIWMSYYFFLKSQGGLFIANVIYVMFTGLLLYLVFITNTRAGFLLTFFYSTLLMFVTKVRIAYLTAPFLFLLASYFLVRLFDLVRNMKANKEAKDWSDYINVFNLVAFIIFVFVLFANVSTGYYTGKYMGTNLNQGWLEALRFLDTNTSKDAVVLSWWDFGYWFQTVGHRKSLLDGGNQKGYRNVYAAKFFTGRYNETWDMLYLAAFHPTHILLDYSMVGKYAAMSKIANNAKFVDSYAQLRLAGQIDRGNTTILKYSLGQASVYFPVSKDGSFNFSQHIVFSTPYGESYIKYLCTPSGPFEVYDDKGIDECIYLLPGYPQIAFMTYKDPRGKVKREIFNSNFHKLYLENGQRVRYVKKVFDNFLVKIYEINYTRVYDYLHAHNITDEFINHTLQVCLNRTEACPLYYTKEDLN